MSVFSADRLKRGLRSPNLFFREANRLYHRRGYTQPYNTAGFDIVDAEWDNLVILDACRYDLFETCSTLPGTLESRVSRGSNTVEFLTGNFSDRRLHDTVYVTANPQFYRHRDRIGAEFHDVVDVWQGDGWDDQKKTVMPETMVNHVFEAFEAYPNKRIIAHFVQPHYPFLSDLDVFNGTKAFLSPDEDGSWYQVMTGDISVATEQVWAAYRETFERALPAVERLLSELSGLSVITADHGNMVGERASPVPVREWGHPAGIYTSALVEVPWLVTDCDQRRPVRADGPMSRDDVTGDTVEQRLRDLGYA